MFSQDPADSLAFKPVHAVSGFLTHKQLFEDFKADHAMPW